MWDAAMGKKFEALAQDKAWEFLVANLYQMRDAFVADLVSGEGNLAEARASVKLIDAMLAVPDQMIDSGDRAAERLNEIANDGSE